MDKYIIAPVLGSTQNSIGADDRPWEEGYFKKLPNWQEYLAESTGYGIASGFDATISGMTVTIASGVYHTENGTRVTTATKTITVNAADATNPRIDLIYLDSNYEVQYIAGVAAANPNTPSLPSGSVCSMYRLYVGANATTITDIADLRQYKETKKGIYNVRDFGAVADVKITGSEEWATNNLDTAIDDTDAINLAIQTAYNNGGGVVIIPKGRYKIAGTVYLKSRVVLMPVGGTVYFIHTAGTGALFSVDAHSIITNSPHDFNKPWIDNSCGDLYCYGKLEATGLDIEGYLDGAPHPGGVGIYIRGVTFSGFKTGIYNHAHSTFFLQFYDCTIRVCHVAYRYGEQLWDSHGSGERDTFTNCLFTSCKCLFYWFAEMTLHITNCSINYSAVVFWGEEASDIWVTNCHCEGNGRTTNLLDRTPSESGVYKFNDWYGFACVNTPNNNFIKVKIHLQGTTYVNDSTENPTPLLGSEKLRLYIENCYFIGADATTKQWYQNKDNNANVMLTGGSNIGYLYLSNNNWNPQAKAGPNNGSVIPSYFADAIQVLSSSTALQDWTITNFPDNATVEIANNDYGGHGLKITTPSDNTFYFAMESKKYYFIKKQRLGAVMFVRVPTTVSHFNDFNVTIYANVYDINDNLLDTVQIGNSYDVSESTYDNYLGDLVPCYVDYGYYNKVKLPDNAFKFKISMRAQLFTAATGAFEVSNWQIYDYD